MEYDLMRIPQDVEKRTHKLRRTVPAPNSYFLKIKCKCEQDIKITFSHAQHTLECDHCGITMCKPSGGKISITEGCQFSVLGVQNAA